MLLQRLKSTGLVHRENTQCRLHLSFIDNHARDCQCSCADSYCCASYNGYGPSQRACRTGAPESRKTSIQVKMDRHDQLKIPAKTARDLKAIEGLGKGTGCCAGPPAVTLTS